MSVGAGPDGAVPGGADTGEATEFEERWTGNYIFGNDTMALVPVTVG